MSSNIIPFSPTGDLPAHVTALFDGVDSNVVAKATIDQLSYRGKVWRLVLKGEETPLTRKNAEGDDEAIPAVNVVVLGLNKGRSRAYYSGPYDGSKNTAPDCASQDGIVPDADIKEPCAKTCATCPNSVKGSKITDNNKQTTACASFKRMAIVPSNQIKKHAPLLLRIAQTSMWDGDNGENEAKGWYAWDQYTDMLRARGCKHTAAVETKVKFDLRVEYPKLLFSASRWLNPDESAAAIERITTDKEAIDNILSGGTHDGVMGTPVAGEDKPAAKTVAKKSGPDIDEEELAAIAAKQAAAKQAAAEKAAAEAKAKAKAEKIAAAQKALAEAQAAEEEEENSTDAFAAAAPVAQAATTKAKTTAKAKPAAEATAPAASAAATPTTAATVEEGVPAGLADLMAGWDD